MAQGSRKPQRDDGCLRLLNSGPHTGLYEIELPALQPGSSTMPGKVNPAVAEMLNMVCYYAIGQDVSVALCAEAGQLDVNVMTSNVTYALPETLAVMTNAVRAFDDKCVWLLRAAPRLRVSNIGRSSQIETSYRKGRGA